MFVCLVSVILWSYYKFMYPVVEYTEQPLGCVIRPLIDLQVGSKMFVCLVSVIRVRCGIVL